MDNQVRGSVSTFGLIWFGQLFSAVGNSLTGFVLGVWVFQTTGSATQFAIIFMAATLPAVLIAPVAGAIADRFDRRWVMVASNAAGGVVIAALAGLLWTDLMQIWHLYLTAGAAALCGTFHMTAFYAITPRLVPKQHLGRANGMLQVTQAARIAAPLLAGVLLATVGLRGVILIDLATTAFAVGILLSLRVSKHLTAPPGSPADRSFVRDLGFGWRYLTQRPHLLRLVALFAGFNFCFAVGGVLVQPLILSFADEVTLGILMFCGGAGFFLGGVAMSAWGGPRRRVRGILWILAVGGVVLGLHGLAPSPWLIAVVAPLFLFALPIINGSTLALVQAKVPGEAMGRVIAAVRMAGHSTMPLAYLLAGPAVDYVAEPAMAPGTALGDSVGQIIGAGEGRGIALIFWIVGAAMVLLALVGATSRKLRNLETEVPDADEIPAPVLTRGGSGR
jgi:MFS transporter, DHA3 family, macrolide efflux protein